MEKGNILDIKNIFNDNLDDVDVKSLEKNPKSLVKLISKNHRLYFYCSKELRQNYDFILDVIDLCKDDIEFIQKVADEFLAIDIKNYNEKEKEQKRLDKYAIAVLMEQNTSDKPNSNYIKYHSMACTYYYSASKKINSIKDKISDRARKYYGFGFGLHQKLFNNELVLEHTASMMIDSIFEQVTNLERDLHKSYSSKDKLLELGLTDILINKIRVYDNLLADFILSHPSLIDKLKDISTELIDNWDEYNRQVQCSKNNAEKIVRQVREYFDQYGGSYSDVSELSYLKYFSKQFDIQEEICAAYKKMNKKAKVELFNFIKDYDDTAIYISKYMDHIKVSSSFYTIFQIFEDNMEDVCKNIVPNEVGMEAAQLLSQRYKNSKNTNTVKTKMIDFKKKGK